MIEQYTNDENPYPVIQGKQEFERLLEIYRELNPRRVLEIGSLHGGTLFEWMANTSSGAKIMSVDLLVSPMDSRYIKQRAGHDYEWYDYAAQFDHMFTVCEKPSQYALGDVCNWFHNVPVDFIFIDGDHTYSGVRADWLVYKDYVRKGGIIAFHDIKRRTEIDQVWMLWDEICDGMYGNYQTEELLSIESQQDWGLGVICL